MHYVKQFNINGVDTKQVACIELHGKPNAATEGAVGVLGIDVDSPLHDVYKCVAVNGSIYTWDLLSSGLSIMSATISGAGVESVEFPYQNLKTPATYVIKIGDLIIDSEGHLYQIDALGSTYCSATYCGTRVVAYGKSAYVLAVEHGFEGSEEDWLKSLKGETGTVDKLACYPVGSIYFSTEPTSPASFIGGVWERIKNCFLYAAGDTPPLAGEKGGSETHTHSLESGYAKYNPSGTSGTARIYKTVVANGYSLNASATSADKFSNTINETGYDAIGLGGNTGSGSNMPPYLVVYVWKRLPDGAIV